MSDSFWLTPTPDTHMRPASAMMPKIGGVHPITSTGRAGLRCVIPAPVSLARAGEFSAAYRAVRTVELK